METEGSLPNSQLPATCPYSEPAQCTWCSVGTSDDVQYNTLI